MITKKQFREAMVIIETYRYQITKSKAGLESHEVGCRVKLSPFGKTMQKSHNQEGTVLDYNPWMGKITDGAVTVKWDHRRKPDSMHINQVEVVKK